MPSTEKIPALCGSPLTINSSERSWIESSQVGSVNVVIILSLEGMITKELLQQAFVNLCKEETKWSMTVKGKNWQLLTSRLFVREAAAEAEPDQIAKTEANDPIPLGECLVRIVWQRLEELNSHRLFITLHHTIVDTFTGKAFMTGMLKHMGAIQSGHWREQTLDELHHGR